ncbi:MAG TPA: glycosyltransferase family 4 protein [Isosphaeraceae bacterium]|jgi:glycosyltransferase involved in cell wall biosynthesis|nr:glycosyltransferase family 4 protein [Isosphaeraceae bacterium]
MVNTLRRLWDGSGRQWRLEGKAADPIAAPKLRIPGVSSDEHPPATRILFVNQYYWPDHASTAQHLTDLAESLAQNGFECHVLCSRRGYRPGRLRLPGFEVHNGVHIHRVAATSFGRRSSLARMLDYLSFYARAVLRSLLLRRFDVVATLTTPPIIGLIGTLLRRLKGSRHVFWSMDLHPDASLALGRMSAKNPVVSALAKLSDAVYRQADKVVVLGPYMADRIASKQVRIDRVVTIPVWSRRDEVYPLPREGHPLRTQLGLADKFVAMYSGNLGLAHAFEEFLEAARHLRDRDDIVFLYVGDGPRMAEVRAAKEREGLNNIRLMDYFPREQLYASLSMADVHLISMRREMTGVVVPGKLYGAMASGRPTLFVGPEHCESADTIRQARCGYTIRLGDVESVLESLTKLAADPELVARLGARGRSAFLAHHEKDVCCARWSGLIGELVGAGAVSDSIPHRPTPVLRPIAQPRINGSY